MTVEFGKSPALRENLKHVDHIHEAFRSLFLRAVEESSLTRKELASKMSELVYGHDNNGICENHLTCWGEEDPTYSLPAWMLPAFIDATGAYFLVAELFKKAPAKPPLIYDPSIRAELRSLERQKLKIEARRRALEKALYDKPMERGAP